MSKAAKIIAYINTRSFIKSISDNRKEGGQIVVSLNEGWFFKETPEMSIRGFATVREASAGASKNTVFNPTLPVKTAKVKKPRVKAVVSAAVTADEPVKAPEKALSMSKDAIRKREKRAAQAAAKAAEAQAE